MSSLMPMLRLWVPAYASALLFQYASGTATKQNTYTTKALSVANDNPLVADSLGHFAPIHLDPSLAYTFVLAPATDTDPPTAAIYTENGVVQGSDQVLTVLSKSAAYSVVATDGEDVVILCDASGGAFTVTLYTAGGNSGYRVRVVKTDASNNAVTVDASGTETINGALTQILSARYEGLAIASDNTNWVGLIQKFKTTLSKTAAYPVAVGDGDDVTVLADGTSGAFSVTLYAAAGNTGRVVTVKKTDSSANAITIDGNAAETIDGGATLALSNQYDWATLECDGSNWHVIAKVAAAATVLQATCDGRLSGTTAVPVTFADVTAATTLYWALYKGSQAALYDGSSTWVLSTLSELSLTMVGLTAAKPYDIFIDYNAGTPQLVSTVWTNDTTRATSLTTQDGVLVQTGNTDWRYVGTIHIDAAGGAVTDSFALRHIWNYYHRVLRPMQVIEATSSWSYTTSTWRQARGTATNQLSFVVGVNEVPLWAHVQCAEANSSSAITASVGIGLDSTSANHAQTTFVGNAPVGGSPASVAATLVCFPGVGRHTAVWLEWSTASGTTTFYSNSSTTRISGISGSIEG